jgi:hypothetical protein
VGRRTDRPGPLVAVYWQDATAASHWEDEWKPGGKTALCISVGWLVEDTEQHITLVRDVADAHDAESRISGGKAVIPKAWVCEVVKQAERRPKPKAET